MSGEFAERDGRRYYQKDAHKCVYGPNDKKRRARRFAENGTHVWLQPVSRCEFLVLVYEDCVQRSVLSSVRHTLT